MKKKNITIDDLALMVQKGFTDITENMATKDETNKHFNSIEKRLDRVENLVLASHQKRIEKLEAEVKELREMFAM
ncbi:MAG: hypothetical protein PHE77_00315 [Candidatus Pacebacteria bacterium]|jgi:sensor histidine kinase YesM|nr:hypothetical protein [Candidatus Paceibacterota bacterium]